MDKPNIIFIAIDASRARNLSCYGYFRKTTPNIDKIAKDGVLFENNFSFSNFSDRSFGSLFGGRHILSEGALDCILNRKEIDGFFDSGGTFIQEILKKQGYKTFFLDIYKGWQKRGFDFCLEEKKELINVRQTVFDIKKIPIISKLAKFAFYHILPKKITERIRRGSFQYGVANTMAKTIEIIKQNKDNKFFAYVFAKDVHLPYIIPKGKFTNKFKARQGKNKFFKAIKSYDFTEEQINFYRTVIDKRDSVEDLIAKYDCAVAYVDSYIGKIIDTLKENNLYDDTIIVICSDHGESHGEHRIYFDHHGLYDVTTNIPLIIKSPDLPKGKRVKAFTQLEDIAPTVLDLIDIKYSPTLFDGKSLIPLMEGRIDKIRDFVLLQENYLCKKTAIRDFDYKYIESPSKEAAVCKRCNFVHGGVIELYNLKNNPGETKNIAKENKEIVLKMSMKLNNKLKQIKDLNERRIIANRVGG